MCLQCSILNIFQVVWYAARTSRESNGPLNPVDFDRVLINNGNTYDAVTDVVTISLPGYYYVHIQLTVCSGTGAVFELRLNGVVAVTCKHNIRNNCCAMSRGQAAMLALKTGDKLSIAMSSSMCIFSADRATTFFGLLLG